MLCCVVWLVTIDVSKKRIAFAFKDAEAQKGFALYALLFSLAGRTVSQFMDEEFAYSSEKTTVHQCSSMTLQIHACLHCAPCRKLLTVKVRFKKCIFLSSLPKINLRNFNS